MIEILKRLTISLCVLATLSGCATVQTAGPDNEEQVATEAGSRTKNTLLTIGGILLLGVIIANEAEDAATDAARDASRP